MKVLMCVCVLVVLVLTVSTVKAEADIRNFKNQLIVEIYPDGPIIPAKTIYFTNSEILVEPIHSEPEYKMFSYTNPPRILYTDGNGIPSETYINYEAGYIIAGDKIIPIPACLE